MTVSGGIKFFTKSKFLYTDGARAWSLGGDSAHGILNHNKLNGWTSTYSNDSITEQVVIDLAEQVEIDRIILNRHNFKDITIYILAGSNKIEQESGFKIIQEYEGGNNTGDFAITQEQGELDDELWDRLLLKEDDYFISLEQTPTSKIQLEQCINVALVPTADTLQLTLTASDVDTSTTYFSFEAVRADRIIFEVTATQVPNQDKTLKSFIGCSELGTFDGYPAVSQLHDRNIIADPVLSGKMVIQKGMETFKATLAFTDHPGQADADLISDLQEYDDDFLIWLCGGREGSTYFTYNIKGWDIDDIYLVNLAAPLPINYTKGIYTNPFNATLSLVEVPG